MSVKTTIHHIVHIETGEQSPIHWIGTDEFGRRIAANPSELWACVDKQGRECVVGYDGDGNFVELETTYAATTAE